MDKIVILSLVCVVVSQTCAMELIDVNQQIQSKKVGIYIAQNYRDSQEDRFYHGAVDGGNLYAVFDGHSGSEVAEFLAKNFHTYFGQASGNSMSERMMEAFKNADNDEFIKNNKACGSTAAVVFVKDNKAHFAHVGDSRAVLENNGGVAFATVDHKPNRADEFIRIDYAGGLVFNKKVNGFLAVSRAFGDYGLDKRLIISEPEYKEETLTKKNRFLILGTDGLWDFMSNEDAARILKAQQSKTPNMNDLAKLLASMAIKEGSRDNIVVMVVDLLSQL